MSTTARSKVAKGTSVMATPRGLADTTHKAKRNNATPTLAQTICKGQAPKRVNNINYTGHRSNIINYAGLRSNTRRKTIKLNQMSQNGYTRTTHTS